MDARLLRWVWIGMASAMAGCGSIADFEVAPYKVCPGDSVRASWEVDRGAASITTIPVLAGTGQVAASGSQSFVPAASTHFVLTAHGLLKDATSEVDVTVLPVSAPQLLAALAYCNADARSVDAEITVPGTVATANLRVSQVQNGQPRLAMVRKDGISASLAAAGASAAFRQRPLIGNWSVSLPLAPDESCAQVLQSVAARLVLTVQLSCGSE